METSVPTRTRQKPSSAQWNNPAAPWSRRRASEDEVRAVAYRIYELNGRQEGHAEQDWLQARQELHAWGTTV